MKRTVVIIAGLSALVFAFASCASKPAAAPAQAAAPAPAPAAEAEAAPVLTAAAPWNYMDGNSADALTKAGFTEVQGGAFGFWKANADGSVSFDTSADGSQKAGITSSPAFADGATMGTFIARMKASDASRGFDIYLDFGNRVEKAAGPRVKFIIAPSKLQIEKPDNQSSASSVSYPMDSSDYNIYQISVTIKGNEAHADVYVNGDDTPVMTAVSVQRSGANAVWIGDNGSNPCKASIDWMAWTDTGAYKPSELKGKLPAELGDLGSYK